jgi:hypothetical protein
MKHFMVLAILSSLSSFAFAAQTSTDCIMMKEQNERTNPKANMADLKEKSKKPKSSVTIQ